MTQTLIFVWTAKQLSVAVRCISILRNTRRRNHSPSPPDGDVTAALPVNEVAVQRNSDGSQGRVLGVGPCIAAIRVRRVALADR